MRQHSSSYLKWTSLDAVINAIESSVNWKRLSEMPPGSNVVDNVVAGVGLVWVADTGNVIWDGMIIT